MRIINSEVKQYHRTQSRKKSDGSTGKYETTQYMVTLKKEEVEAQNFQDVKHVSVVLPAELESLESSERECRSNLIQLQKDLIELQKIKISYDNLQVENDKLQNKYNHTQEVLNKREKELSDAQNEIKTLRDRGIIEVVLDKLRKKPAIESKEEKE